MTDSNAGLVDMHAHFSPPTAAAARYAMWEAGRRQSFLARHPYAWSVAATLDFMEQTGTALQILSNVPTDLRGLHTSNDYGAQLVEDHPHRFGLLAAIPTVDSDVARAELARMTSVADGYAVSTTYAGHSLADPKLEPLWEELNARSAVVFVHPNAYAPAAAGLPAPLIEVAFDTARTVIAMLYAGVFTRHRDITFVIAHCGGALPLLAGRLSLLGAEEWVPNPTGLTRDDIAGTLRRLWVDTAASASAQQLTAAVQTFGAAHLVYGSDWGVPCTTVDTAKRNIEALNKSSVISEAPEHGHTVHDRAGLLFPRVAKRLADGALP